MRKLAREIGVNIREVKGSGPRGRISAEDVKRHARQRPAAPIAKPSGPGQRAPMNNIRRVTARQMSKAWAEIPHVTLHRALDITDLDGLRKQHKAYVAEAGGKLTLTPLLVKTVALALRRNPGINASLDLEGEALIHHPEINIGVAVDTPKGLLVPVIRGADKKRVIDIAVELEALSAKAHAGRLSLEEMSGGTFTISNLGGLGVERFTPIVNPPQVAILGVGRARIEPVYDGEAFAPRLRMPLSLSFDHRAVDGADGARLLESLAELIQSPFLIALEAA